ncbi:transposase [Acidobacteriota bacterium]
MFIITFQLRRNSSREDELAVLRFIILEFPDSGIAHFNLAEAHEHYGNIEEVVKYCAKALELNPAFEDAVAMRKRLEDDFPAEHWRHIRTTNPIESTFATVRHRTRQTKGCGSRTATLMMVFKLTTQAERRWRKLNNAQMLTHVIRDVSFVDGVMKKAA